MRVFLVLKYRGLSEMSIENQITDHCNPLESSCPKCGENMFMSLGSTLLECASDECDHTIETDED